jgi:PAS domain S-box-containing protein
MFDQAPLSYQSLDENGNFTAVNETWLNTMGYEKDEVLGKNFSEF